MKTIGLVLTALVLAVVGAHSMDDPGFGPVTVQIVVQVVSSTSKEPIPDVFVRLTDLDYPFPRQYARSIPSEQTTDALGYAVLQTEFDAAGRSKETAKWFLRGRLEIEKNGYASIRNWLLDIGGEMEYPTDTDRLDFQIFLKPSKEAPSFAAISAVPIYQNDPYEHRDVYIYNGKVFVGGLFDAGHASLVNAISASGPMDDQLQKLISSYKCRLSLWRGLRWSGAILVLSSVVGMARFSEKENPSEADWTWGSIAGVTGLVGGVAWLVGMHTAGPPTAIVNYYNRANR